MEQKIKGVAEGKMGTFGIGHEIDMEKLRLPTSKPNDHPTFPEGDQIQSFQIIQH